MKNSQLLLALEGFPANGCKLEKLIISSFMFRMMFYQYLGRFLLSFERLLGIQPLLKKMAGRRHRAE